MVEFSVERFKRKYDDPNGLNIIFSSYDEFRQFVNYIESNNYSLAINDLDERARELFEGDGCDAIVLDNEKDLNGFEQKEYAADYFYDEITFPSYCNLNIQKVDLFDFLTA